MWLVFVMGSAPTVPNTISLVPIEMLMLTSPHSANSPPFIPYRFRRYLPVNQSIRSNASHVAEQQFKLHTASTPEYQIRLQVCTSLQNHWLNCYSNPLSRLWRRNLRSFLHVQGKSNIRDVSPFVTTTFGKELVEGMTKNAQGIMWRRKLKYLFPSYFLQEPVNPFT